MLLPSSKDKKKAKSELDIQESVTNETDTKASKKKKNPFVAAISGVDNLLTAIGQYVFHIFIWMIQVFWRWFTFGVRFLWVKTNRLRKLMMRGVEQLGIFVFSPIVRCIQYFREMCLEMKQAKIDNAEKSSFRICSRYVFSFLFGKKGLFITLFNYAAPVISIVFFFNIVSYASSINYAVKLTVNGEFIGYIENEQVFTDAEVILKQRLSYLGSNYNITAVPEYSIEKIEYSGTLSKYQIADLLLQKSNVSIEYAYGVYVDDTFYGAVLDNTRLKQVLEDLLEQYRTGAEDETVEFVNEVTCDKGGLYLSDSIVDEQEIIDRFTSLKTIATYYTVQEGDSHSLISDKLNLTMTELEALNPGFANSTLYVGDQIKCNADVPYLAVAVTRIEEYNSPVPYTTIYKEDNLLYTGNQRVTTKGVNGTDLVTARVSYVNGVETKRIILDSVRISDPVTEVIAKGTKPVTGYYSSASASYGKFIWPVDGGYISEYTYWDGGYYGHMGIDIAAPYGTAIFAGDSGKVVHSGWYYNYGYTVIIQHPSGLSTLYAHCSKLNVSVGEYVSQGQMIAQIGSTGYSTGNHLHFEVRNGSIKYNPIKYLDF